MRVRERTRTCTYMQLGVVDEEAIADRYHGTASSAQLWAT